MENSEIIKRKRFRTKKSTLIGLTVATCILSVTTLGLGISQGITSSRIKETENQLEGYYQKSYYNLVDSTNSCDTDMSKLLSSNSESYRAKMLEKVNQSAKERQESVSGLPLSSEGVLECTKFINQMSGYTQILEEKLNNGEALSQDEIETLEQMHISINELKDFLNDMSQDMISGRRIIDMRRMVYGDYDGFSWSFSQISSTEYPTMIYDGPFSDSVENKQIVGLVGDEISKDDAYKIVDEMFENAININYIGFSKGKFETYNFKVTSVENQNIYVQITKKGGHILTISGNEKSTTENLDYETAKKIALGFAEKNNIENAEVVWHQKVGTQIYFNLAPVVNDVVIYPDLVKVKIDLSNGNVIGYDAMSYYTNHIERTNLNPEISVLQAEEMIGDGFDIKTKKLALCPLDFNREVLCYEFMCTKDNSTFYIYINAVNLEEENILKVVETSSSSKLM